MCFRGGVVVVSAEGVIRKLDFNGNFAFVAKPAEFDGACLLVGKANDDCIFMTQIQYDVRDKHFRYQLVLVDVSGTAPAVKARFNTVQPMRIAKTSEEIIVIGETDTLRFKIPENCKP